MNLKKSQTEPQHVAGGKFPAAQPDLDRPLNEEAQPFIVPSGPASGTLEPENPASQTRKPSPMTKLTEEIISHEKHETNCHTHCHHHLASALAVLARM
jgi:hypothetical protein